MRQTFYRLRGREVEEVFSLFEWARWFEKADRHVAETTLALDDDGANAWVSTVFLGLDHGYLSDGPPVLFETMVFIHGTTAPHGEEASFTETFGRYCTWGEAEQGHAAVVERTARGIAEMRSEAQAVSEGIKGVFQVERALMKRIREKV